MTASAGELHQLQAVDGSRVRYRRWLPDGDVRGTIQLVHGASEHSGRYGRLARRSPPAASASGPWTCAGTAGPPRAPASAGSVAASAWIPCWTMSRPCTW